MYAERGAIPFNRPFMVGTELAYVREAHANMHLSGDGEFTARCHRWLEDRIGCGTALLTQSCTAALEMAALLLDIGPGDEVIMPSYTFVSTANAFALRGGVPVFVDVREDTLNLDEELVERAVTSRTKAVVPVHYAGVPCDMRAIVEVAERNGLFVVEDAAQALMSTYHGEPAGGIGHLGTFSFHETKNITCGEGGALLINDPRFADRARLIREKGTNRTQFLAGRVDKYSWVDLGSSYLPSEITAAFLWAQMETAEDITSRRLRIWDRYHQELGDLERDGFLRRPRVPEGCTGNAHMYHVLLPRDRPRRECVEALAARGVDVVSHYVPLHGSPAGRRLGRISGDMAVTDDVSRRIIRLPLWLGLENEQHKVIKALYDVLGGMAGRRRSADG